MEKEEDKALQKEVGHRLAQARKKAGFSQTAAAPRLGLKQSNLSAAEAGKAKIALETLVKACTLYKVSADWILSGKEMRETNEYTEELLNLAILFDDVLYKLNKLQTGEQIEEVRQFINMLLLPQDEYEY